MTRFVVTSTLLGGLTLGLVAAGCGGGGGGGGSMSTASAATSGGQLEVQVTDAPLRDLTHVKKAEITVERVEVHVASVASASATGVGSASAAIASSPTAGVGQASGGPANAHGGNPMAEGGNPMARNPVAQGGNPSPGGAAAVGSASGSGSATAGGTGQGRGAPGNGQGTWTTIFDAAQAGAPRVFNLLDLRGGVTALLTSVNLPAGDYTHLRLVISAGELVVDQTTYSTANGRLSNPTGTLQVAFSGANTITVVPGQTTQVLLDFDVARSFDSVGNPSAPTSFKLLPVVRGANLATTGSLAGVVLSDALTPADTTDDVPLASVAVTAVQQGPGGAGPNATLSTYTDANGAYVLAGVDVGTWAVTFQDPAHVDQTVSVTITRGQQTTQDVVLVKK